MYSFMKQERPDDAEIEEMAMKMIQAHQARLQAGVGRPPQSSQLGGSNMTILSLITRKKNDNSNTATLTVTPSVGDEESVRGRFGWTTVGKEDIPYITRNDEQYCAVRMVEMRVLNKYLTFLHQDICNCTCIRSYYITEAESRLLNEINIKHSDWLFGRDHFTCLDLIVRVSDAQQFHSFLDTCYSKLLSGSNCNIARCGFIRINKESVVPFTMYNDEKYVPLFYFEGETESLKLKADKLEGWDLAYLKFCCKVQGIRNELFAHDYCSVIALAEIRKYFPPNTMFEDYWPTKVADSQLLVNGKAQTQPQWTRQPASGPPITPAQPAPSPKPGEQAKVANNANNTQLPNVPNMYANYAQPTFPVLQPRPTNTAIRTSYSTSVAARPHKPPFYAMAPAPPPPLIRAPQPIPTFTNSPNVAATNYLMLSDTTIVPATYRQAAPQMPKYPPPLIPVRHLNGEVQYESPQNHYMSNDIVDLSGPNRTLPPQITLQIAPQPSHEQPPQQPTVQEERQNVPNGRPSINSVPRKLIPIADTPTSGAHIPYQMNKAFIESRMIPCINMKPYVYTELLVTIPDLIEHLFNNVPIQSCQQVMQVLGIDLYKGNKAQMRVLCENGKCQSINDSIPLVPVRLVLEFMPQIKYMLGGLMNFETNIKRQKRSTS